MAMGKRISIAVQVLLIAVTLSVLSRTPVEATANGNHQVSRRLPTQRVRGLQRDIGIESEKLAEKVKISTKNKAARDKPNLPGVFRPVPKKFEELGLKIELPKGDTKSEIKLPESKHATDIKVNRKEGADQKIGESSLNLKGNDIAGINKNNKKNENSLENGLEHFREVEVEIYNREIPSFSIQFTVEDSSSSNLPNLADYNELSDVSEEYLDKFFRSVFEDVQVRHDGTVLFVMVSEDDPYTVDFRITLEFIIPGEVPTINFLIDRLQDGLERDTSRAFFISDLSMMSETNPFSKTESFRVVSRPPVSAAEMGRGVGNKTPVVSLDNVGKGSVLKYLLASMGCVVLVGAALMWRKRKFKRSDVSSEKQIFSLFDKTNKKDTTTSSNVSGIYGADEETMNYLNSIRKRYRDYDGKKQPSSPTSMRNNIAAVEQTGSYDDSEDSMTDSVGVDSDNERKDHDGLDDDLKTLC